MQPYTIPEFKNFCNSYARHHLCISYERNFENFSVLKRHSTFFQFLTTSLAMLISTPSARAFPNPLFQKKVYNTWVHPKLTPFNVLN